MKQKNKIMVISNPVAGQRSHGFVKAVLREFLARGYQVELKVTEKPGHGTSLAQQCASEKQETLIVAAGGDGTIREVAEGLIGSDIPFGLIPAGTANVLARELGYFKNGRRHVRRTVDIITGTFQSSVYPFSVTTPAGTQTGMCWVGVGFDARVLGYVNTTLKRKIGKAAFVSAILKAMWKEPPSPSVPWAFADPNINPDMSQGIGKETGECSWGLIANIARYAGSFKLTNQTNIGQKGLACLLFKPAGWFARAKDQVNIMFGTLDERGETRSFTEGYLDLGSPQTPVQLDGDLIGFGPVKVQPMDAPLYVKAAEGL